MTDGGDLGGEDLNEKCFALKPGRKCSLLTCKGCNGQYDKCPFYKPRWKAERDTRRALARIASMPVEKQQAIAEKYYNGEMPWQGALI